MAHAEVQVPDTLWKEPGVLWLAIGMPTGKTILVSSDQEVMFSFQPNFSVANSDDISLLCKHSVSCLQSSVCVHVTHDAII